MKDHQIFGKGDLDIDQLFFFEISGITNDESGDTILLRKRFQKSLPIGERHNQMTDLWVFFGHEPESRRLRRFQQKKGFRDSPAVFGSASRGSAGLFCPVAGRFWQRCRSRATRGAKTLFLGLFWVLFPARLQRPVRLSSPQPWQLASFQGGRGGVWRCSVG